MRAEPTNGLERLICSKNPRLIPRVFGWVAVGILFGIPAITQYSDVRLQSSRRRRGFRGWACFGEFSSRSKRRGEPLLKYNHKHCGNGACHKGCDANKGVWLAYIGAHSYTAGANGCFGFARTVA